MKYLSSSLFLCDPLRTLRFTVFNVPPRNTTLDHQLPAAEAAEDSERALSITTDPDQRVSVLGITIARNAPRRPSTDCALCKPSSSASQG